MNRPSKRKRMAMARKGHLHSPPVRKAELVGLNMGIALTSIALRSSTPCALASAKAKSPTTGAYAPIFGAGQGKHKPKVNHKLKQAETINAVENRVGYTPPRKYKAHPVIGVMSKPTYEIAREPTTRGDGNRHLPERTGPNIRKYKAYLRATGKIGELE